MKISNFASAIAVLSLCAFNASATIRYVDVNSTSPVAPYKDWSTAATNIQDAIDASVDGDQILVTNGVYRSGGKIMTGDLTNRVALDKAVTVQSVNGPWLTTIQGIGPGTGPSFVRCAWLTNGASLIGFTLKWGGTRATGDTVTLQSGGGVWCASSNAIVVNCVIATNAAASLGAGVFRGTINNSLIRANELSYSSQGTAAYGANLNNCTISGNVGLSSASVGSAIYTCRLTNCIVYSNVGNNYSASGSIFSYCCTTPMPPGFGNFTTAPQLFPDGIHLSAGSPCIGTGTNRTTGTDIFGKPWANPPSVGCAEWTTEPLAGQPRIKLTSDPIGFTVTAAASGQTPLGFSWLRNGTLVQNDGHFSGAQSTNLIATGVGFADAGAYQLVVSNAFGVVTGGVAQLVIHCVDVAGTNPTAPYSTWETAATNIQDAINVATSAEVVLVTNGVYATGGKLQGGLTNRVSIDRAILVQSVNGASVTTIQGARNPVNTNGIQAVRCVWMTNNAILGGFTLRGGATQTGASGVGGGVWGPFTNKSPNTVVWRCVIAGNAAANAGGGAYCVTLNDCTVMENIVTTGDSSGGGGGAFRCALRNCIVATNSVFGSSFTASGGGVQSCSLRNCALLQNIASSSGGGAANSSLINCTVSRNTSYGNSGGGAATSTLTNCVVYGNFAANGSNYYNSTFTFSCTAPAASGVGNISSNPHLLTDGIHISAASPCAGAGTNTASFADIDGQSWSTPPAMGCDEPHPEPIIAGQPNLQIGVPAHGFTLSVTPAGQPPFLYFWSRDDSLIQNDVHYTNSGSANLIVKNFGPEHAGSYRVVVSNSFGVVTSATVQVRIHVADAAGVNPIPPYSTWATAATKIQDAIDVASVGDIVLVTNGIYSSGGKAMAGGLTNRVALDKVLTVMSANGPWDTVIQGAWDPIATNGPGAVRCAWVADGAVLNGFTLRGGATRTMSDPAGEVARSGGAAWANNSGFVVNCVLTNNRAIYGGGIAYGALRNSLVVQNMANNGGGAYGADLSNCTLLFNFTLGPGFGAGTHNSAVRNSIVLDNYSGYPFVGTEDNYYATSPYTFPASYDFSCTRPTYRPMPSGTGNINAANVNPQLLDLFHIAATSPLRGAASSSFVDGFDLDGEPWANPPSMGCDEVIYANFTGPLSVELQSQVLPGTSLTNLLPKKPVIFYGLISGRASRVEWSFGDGPVVTNLGANASHAWTNVGDFTITFTVFNNDHPTGVSTNLAVHIVPLNTPQIGSLGLATNGFQFQFAGQSGADYTIQYATNLAPPITWQTLQTIYNSTGGVHQVSDTTSTDNSRFYRVLAQ